MGSKDIKASKCTVLFPDELDIVDVMGERFHAENWFKYMSDRLKEKRSISESQEYEGPEHPRKEEVDASTVSGFYWRRPT